MSILDAPPIFKPPFVPALAPYGPVTNRQFFAQQNFSDGTSQSSTYRCTHNVQEDTPYIQVVWINAATGTTNGTSLNAVTYGAAMDFIPAGTSINSVTPRNFTFAGQDTVDVAKGGFLVSDPMWGPFKKGDVVLIRTWVSVGTLGQKWPVGVALNYGFDGVLAGDQRGAPNFSTSFPFLANPGVSPCLILGPTANRPSVAGVGDSIMDGAGDSGAFPGNAGFLTRALDGFMGYCKMAAPGERVASVVDRVSATTGYRWRGSVAPHAGNIVSNYGTNDLGAGDSLATVQANLIAFWRFFMPTRRRVFQCTLLPRASSSDSWATATNQTPPVFEGFRTSLNTWLRQGAPVDSTTLAVAALGALGSITAGQAGHPLYAIFDVAQPCEVNSANVLTLNGGRWLTTGAANYPTTDGTHPSTAISVLMATKIDKTKFVV